MSNSASSPKLTNDREIKDLEIKDAQLIFSAVWDELEEEFGRQNLCFPKELILVGGAPGAGKGTHTRFILKARGLTCPPIVVSDLLTTPEAQRLKDQGFMVGDKEVVGIMLRKLLEPEFRDGALLDGFPRTSVQVECLKLLVNEINQLHNEFAHTPLAMNFRRPIVHAMVLFIAEKTSIERQLKRGREIAAHNKRVAETGDGHELELRATDLDESAARRRYMVFKEKTWSALKSLKEIYHYHFVNAEGPIEEVEQNILDELKYQSTLELEPETYDRVRNIPLAEEIILHARQELVKRLDSYEREHTELFTRVVELIERKFMPIIQRHALSGRAQLNTEDDLFGQSLVLPMVLDVFSERGFHAVIDKTISEIPVRINLQTGEVECRQKAVYRIQVNFRGSEIRRG
jgi:adenylate kinase